MDPSEKLEFERDLESDSDLLIEVESFKAISENLNKLGYINPPDDVVQAVCDSARKSSSKSGNNYWRTFFYSAAAILLIGLTSGIFMMDDRTGGAGNDSTESASVTASPTFSQPVRSSNPDALTPWVDNNEILYFQGQSTAASHASIDSIRNDSFKKLTPVTDPALIRTYQSQLQLTGSRN